VPVGTAFHERTLALCESLNYREWSGYYTVGVYEMHHEHEYNAIRNSSALIDISPLFKYRVTGRDATKFVNRVISRDINKVSVDQVIYCCWCDPDGKVIDDGTITRLGENDYRWTAADPSLRWFQQNALGLNVKIEDISEQTAALALQGPTSGRLLHVAADANIANLKYFRVTHGKIAGVPVDISRTGYTGDLGFEIWMPWKDAVRVWDKLMSEGEVFDIHPAGMVALDIARIEASLILIEVAYISRKPEILPSRNRFGQARGSEERNICGARRPGITREKGPHALAGGPGNQLERSGSALRQDGNGAAGSEYGLSCRGAGVSWRKARGQGDLDDVVPDAEEDDRAGICGAGTLRGRKHAEHGNDRRVFQAHSIGENCADAVLQSTQEDRDANPLVGRSEFLGGRKQCVKRSAIEQLATNDQCPDFLRVVDILERVGIQ
jgi:hypothetical protein